jgi:hypothetical protein
MIEHAKLGRMYHDHKGEILHLHTLCGKLNELKNELKSEDQKSPCWHSIRFHSYEKKCQKMTLHTRLGTLNFGKASAVSFKTMKGHKHGH